MLRNVHMRSVMSVLLFGTPFLAACGDDAADDADATTPAAEAAASEATPESEAAFASAEAEADMPVALADALAGETDLTVFGRVWTESRLSHELDGETLTLFVPNNAAFASRSEGELAGEANARAFVLRHTVSGALDRATLAELDGVERREGSALPIETNEEGLFVGSARVLRSFQAGDVTVHVVNQVLEAGA